MATRASGKRKRASHPPTAANSPAARRARGGGAAAAAEPPTLVEVEGKWAEAMQGTREKGQFLDVTLLAGQQKIAAHKTIIVSYSPYLEGLLTSGLAESAQAGDEVRVGDASTDGSAVEAIVDCFYSGKLALSTASVTAVIVAANMLQVGAIEKAANEFFVEKLEPASAAQALGFSAQRVECGEAARELHGKCTEYVLEHFKECSGSGSLLQLPAEALVPLLGSDELAADSEEQVLDFVGAWVERDVAGRRAVLKDLAPLIRFPLLSTATQLSLGSSPLIAAMQEDASAVRLVPDLLLECLPAFKESAAAAACPRLKPRRGALGATDFTWDPHCLATCAHARLADGNRRLQGTGDSLFRPMLGTAEFSSGRHSWTVRGTRWSYAMVGIALREVNRGLPVGANKATSRVFGRLQGLLLTVITHQKSVSGLTDDSVLTLTLDCDAGTFAVAVDGVDKPELTFTEGIAGKTWFPVAGINDSASSVTIIPAMS
jgi:hypothetical protein